MIMVRFLFIFIQNLVKFAKKSQIFNQQILKFDGIFVNE